MKTLKYLFLSTLVVFMAACAGDEKLPFVEFDDLGYGAYPRLIDGVNGALDYEDPNASQINFTVEFYDDAQGQNVDNIEWSVSYLTHGPAVLEKREKGAFGTSPDGLPSAEFTFTFQQVFDALGIDLSAINSGDPFTFTSVVTKTDGSTFTSSTSSGSIQSGVFGGFFIYQAAVKNLPCKSQLAGTFDAVTTVRNIEAGIGWDDCGGNMWEGTVIWEAVHDPESFDKGRYNIFVMSEAGDKWNDASMGAYFACYESSAEGSLPNGEGGATGSVGIGESCSILNWEGQSQWGEVYTFDAVSADGIKLTLSWANDYGEAGSVVLTRTDGVTWPADMTF